MDTKLKLKLTRKLLKNIDKIPEGCWLWKSRLKKQGYGQITYTLEGKTKYTSPHRLAYILFRNRPDLLTDTALWACHTCKHKHCINPDHIRIGDWLDNAMDDVMRNPHVGRKFDLKIEQLYRERYGIRACHDVRKHFKRRFYGRS